MEIGGETRGVHRRQASFFCGAIVNGSLTTASQIGVWQGRKPATDGLAKTAVENRLIRPGDIPFIPRLNIIRAQPVRPPSNAHAIQAEAM
jgi:hypothetical protein